MLIGYSEILYRVAFDIIVHMYIHIIIYVESFTLKIIKIIFLLFIYRVKVLSYWSGWTLLFNLTHRSWGKDTRDNLPRMDTILYWLLIVNLAIVIAVKSCSGELVSMAINAKVIHILYVVHIFDWRCVAAYIKYIFLW